MCISLVSLASVLSFCLHITWMSFDSFTSFASPPFLLIALSSSCLLSFAPVLSIHLYVVCALLFAFVLLLHSYLVCVSSARVSYWFPVHYFFASPLLLCSVRLLLVFIVNLFVFLYDYINFKRFIILCTDCFHDLQTVTLILSNFYNFLLNSIHTISICVSYIILLLFVTPFAITFSMKLAFVLTITPSLRDTLEKLFFLPFLRLIGLDVVVIHTHSPDGATVILLIRSWLSPTSSVPFSAYIVLQGFQHSPRFTGKNSTILESWLILCFAWCLPALFQNLQLISMT